MLSDKGNQFLAMPYDFGFDPWNPPVIFWHKVGEKLVKLRRGNFVKITIQECHFLNNILIHRQSPKDHEMVEALSIFFREIVIITGVLDVPDMFNVIEKTKLAQTL
jgi:hypothetical protein